MSRVPQSRPLRDIERSRLDQISQQFTAAWQARGSGGGEVYLPMFLPPVGDSLRTHTLLQLIPIDLEHRWRRGETVLLENYLKTYPELGTASDLPAELVCAEYKARAQRGTPPPLEIYQSRFPKQFETLLSQINQLVSGEVPAPTLTAGRLPSGTLSADSATQWVANEPRRVVPLAEGYQLLECIGRGSFGEVWRGVAPGGVEVAVKMITWTDTGKLSQFELRALELVKRLRHTFLLQVQAYWLAEGQLYIVMDLAEQSLFQRCQECRQKGMRGIPETELLQYMREAAEALDYLHVNQVLHRDIKPANIMLSSGHARLADFGIARLIMREGVDVQATMVGTPMYMGPEVWDRQVGPWSDQYSLASTYVEMRLGRPLFSGDTQKEMMMNHLSAKPNLGVMPQAEQDVLLRALAKKTEDRYPSCGEFVRQLQHAVDPPSAPAQPRPAVRMALSLALLLVAVVTGAILAPAFWRPSSAQPASARLEMTAPKAVSVVAGEEKEFEIHLRGISSLHDGPLQFLNVPKDVQFTPERVDTGENASTTDSHIWLVRVTADLNLPAENFGRTHDVTLRASASKENSQEGTVEQLLRLSIKPPLMEVPNDRYFQPTSNAKRVSVEPERKNYWTRLERRLPQGVMLKSGTPCELVLVPYNAEKKVPSFYIMQDKVWNELFAAFEEQYVRDHPGAAPSSEWPEDWRTRGAARGKGDMPANDYPLHPVMSVNYEQAKAFARWLGGALPTCEQWDTAAGLYDSNSPRQGPFSGAWETNGNKLQLAINRVADGTLPVGDADDDVSPYGCRDMSGNGAEWTREVSSFGFATVVLRGRRYDKGRPLFFDDLRDPKQLEIEREGPEATSPFIGFRVVIELPGEPRT